MEPEKDAVANFLNEVTPDKELFKEEEPEEEKLTVEEDSEAKPLPFHKDPKVQRYVDKQIEKALKDVKPAERQFRQDVEDIKLPASFIKLVGNDTDEKVQVLKDLSNYFGTLKGEARQEFLDEMKQQQQQQTDADTKAQDELDTYFEEIEETYNVDLSSNSATAKKMRSDFVEYVRKIAPKNDEGEVTGFPDLVASFEEFQDKGKRAPSNNRAKELASRGMARSTDASTAVPTGRSWKDVDKFFGSFKN